MRDVFRKILGRRRAVADKNARGRPLSEANEIQLAFQQEMILIFNEAGAGAVPPIPPMQKPTTVADKIDGRELAKRKGEMEQKGTLQTLGFEPEHIRVFKSLAFLLGECSRLKATPQNLAILRPLFQPTHPVTPTVADAAEEVIAALVDSIEPAKE